MTRRNKTRICLKKAHHECSYGHLKTPKYCPASRTRSVAGTQPDPDPPSGHHHSPAEDDSSNGRKIGAFRLEKSTNSSRTGAQLSFETQQSDCRSDLGGRLTNSGGRGRVSRKLQEEVAACGGIFWLGLRGRFPLFSARRNAPAARLDAALIPE